MLRDIFPKASILKSGSKLDFLFWIRIPAALLFGQFYYKKVTLVKNMLLLMLPTDFQPLNGNTVQRVKSYLLNISAQSICIIILLANSSLSELTTKV